MTQVNTSDKAPAPQAEPKPEKDQQNGITRPKAETKTGRVWAIADAQSKNLGSPAPRKPVLEEAKSEGINPATAATQYGRWRKYHGLEGKGTESDAAAPKAEAAAEDSAPEAGVE